MNRFQPSGAEELLGSHQGACFVRVASPSSDFLNRIRQKAAQGGLVLETPFTAPTVTEAETVTGVIGPCLNLAPDALESVLQPAASGLNAEARRAAAQQISDRLSALAAKKKPEAILRNNLVRLIVWLDRYPLPGAHPTVLCTADCRSNEMDFLSVLNAMGADVVLALKAGAPDPDPRNELSDLIDGTVQRVPAAPVIPQPPRPAAPVLDIPGAQTRRTAAPTLDVPGMQPQRTAAPTMSAPAQPQPRTAAPVMNAPVAPRRSEPVPELQLPVSPVRHVQGLGSRAEPAAQEQPQQPVRRGPVPADRFPLDKLRPETNSWMSVPDWRLIRKNQKERGEEPGVFRNAFVRLTGVENMLTYRQDLLDFRRQLEKGKRRLLVLDGIPAVTAEESSKGEWGNYRTAEELAVSMTRLLPVIRDPELQQLLKHGFACAVMSAAPHCSSVQKLKNEAVLAICCLRRYVRDLTEKDWSRSLPVVILTNGCRRESDCILMETLSYLPVDVFIVNPDQEHPCLLRSDTLLDLRFDGSAELKSFPSDEDGYQTIGAIAESDFRGATGGEAGLYGTMERKHADAIILTSSYEELCQFWKEPLQVRPGFADINGRIKMPTFFCQVNGVPDKKIESYWTDIRQMKLSNTLYLPQMPAFPEDVAHRLRPLAARSLKGRQLDRDQMKREQEYPFGELRPELQEHLLDKLQLMLDRRIILGTFVNGVENDVIAAVLALPEYLVRMLNSFDFTRQNPKVIVVSAKKGGATLTDAATLVFLALCGFDVVMFAPNGYQTIGKYLQGMDLCQHNIGEFTFDLTVPDLNEVKEGFFASMARFFGGGR